MSRALIIIPARFASTRLPGKPLLTETGKPLIQHTVEAANCVANADVLVATDDQRIFDVVTGFGAHAVMTDPGHQSGSDRAAEAARLVKSKAEIIVNVQGDEPEIDPAAINLLIATHTKAQDSERPAFVSTLVCPFTDENTANSPNAVKAVLSQADTSGVRSALYFSRARIPFLRSAAQHAYLHLGLYAFSPESLQAFPALAQTPLEKTEALEQLRILEHGHRIAVAEVAHATPGIDTPEDYKAFVARQKA